MREAMKIITCALVALAAAACTDTHEPQQTQHQAIVAPADPNMRQPLPGAPPKVDNALIVPADPNLHQPYPQNPPVDPQTAPLPNAAPMPQPPCTSCPLPGHMNPGQPAQ